MAIEASTSWPAQKRRSFFGAAAPASDRAAASDVHVTHVINRACGSPLTALAMEFFLGPSLAATQSVVRPENPDSVSDRLFIAGKNGPRTKVPPGSDHLGGSMGDARIISRRLLVVGGSLSGQPLVE